MHEMAVCYKCDTSSSCATSVALSCMMSRHRSVRKAGERFNTVEALVCYIGALVHTMLLRPSA